MKLEAGPLGGAVASVSAILWTICSLIVAVAPEPSAALTRSLFHVASGVPALSVTWGGYVLGLCVWSLGSGLFAWLCARLYNRMTLRREP